MSDYDFPELPSDEELGITEEDVETYGDQVADDGPELTEEERKALLGDDPPANRDAPGAGRPPARTSEGGGGRKARRQEKRRRREARKKAKEEKRRAREARKAAEAKAAERRKAAEAEKAAEAKTGEGAGDGAESQAEREGARGASGDVGAAASGGGGPGAPDVPTDEADRGGPEPLAPMPSWRGPVTLLFLLVLALFSSTRTGQVDPAPADAPDESFSSARAMSILTDIARAPHPTGSPEHARVREILMERLRRLGLEPEVQTATTLLERPGGVYGDPAFARAATVRNIVSRIPGSDPTGSIVVTAHYDSRGIAVGAGDDGTGVVVILEALRALQSDPPLRNDVIVLLTDAEELGLLGARAFVDEHPWMRGVDLVLSFEMRGGGGPSIMFETKERNGWVVRALRGFDPPPLANSMSFEVYRRMPNDTDFTPFREAGVQGLNFAAVDRGHVYHQAYDVPENVSPSTLQHHGTQALASLRHFGRSDLTAVDDADVVFFSVPVLGLVVYDRLWVIGISLALLLGFGVLVAAARRAGARPARIVGGVAVSVVAGAAAYAAGALLFGWLKGFHPEYGALHGSAFHFEGWYVISIGLLALLPVVGGAALSRRWIAPLELAIGGVVLPLAAAVVLGFVAPLAAMNLQWPVGAAVLSVLVMALLGARSSGLVGWIVAMALVVPVFVLLQPVLEIVWLALKLEMAGGLAVVATIGFLLCLPLLTSLEAPNRWWAPSTLLVLAAIAVATGIATSGPSSEAPAPSTLIYAYEHGADDAVWVTSPDDASSSAPGRAWARDRVGQAFSASRDLEDFWYPPGEMPVAPARALLADPPVVDVVTDTVIGNSRRAVLRVRSRIGAEVLAFQLDGDARPMSFNGRPISNVEELRWIDHWGVPDTAVVLELTMPAGSPIDVHVVEHLLRPEELLGQDAFRRPPELAPDITRNSDRAMFRYSVAAFADPRHSSGETVVTPPPNTGVPGELLEIRSDTLRAPPDTGAPTDSVQAPASTGETVDPAEAPDAAATVDSTTVADSATTVDTTAARDTVGGR